MVNFSFPVRIFWNFEILYIIWVCKIVTVASCGSSKAIILKGHQVMAHSLACYKTARRTFKRTFLGLLPQIIPNPWGEQTIQYRHVHNNFGECQYMFTVEIWAWVTIIWHASIFPDNTDVLQGTELSSMRNFVSWV